MVITTKNLNRIEMWTKNDVCVITDFDRTITNSTGGSWGIFSKPGVFPRQYTKDVDELYDLYRPDINYKKSIYSKWWREHVSLFTKYELSEEAFQINIIKQCNLLKFRDGAKEFLTKLNQQNIPLIIISAGIGNVIEHFLKFHECMYSNISIISNYIEFKNSYAVGMSEHIHPTNKKSGLDKKPQIVSLLRQNKILLGDMILDLDVISKKMLSNALKLGFLDKNIQDNILLYKQNFDIVFVDNEGYSYIIDKLAHIIDV